MKRIKKEDLFNNDIFLFDVNGVIKDSDGIIPGTPELLAKLVSEEKIVFLLSNGTQKSEQAISSYAKKGFIQGIHFQEFITSGELAYKILSNNELSFEANQSPKTYKIFGTPRRELFADSDYQEVASYADADFVYISIPQLTPEQVSKLPAEFIEENIFPSAAIKGQFDSIDSSVFEAELQEIKSHNLPIFSANPDMVASELEDGTDKGHFVIRQGTIGKMYSDMGGEIQEIGKPNSEIYDFTMNILKNKYNINIENSNILMIGDTLQTDILGADNANKELGAKIESILVQTGVSANKAGISEEDSEEEIILKLEQEFTKQNIFPKYILKTIGNEK